MFFGNTFFVGVEARIDERIGEENALAVESVHNYGLIINPFFRKVKQGALINCKTTPQVQRRQETFLQGARKMLILTICNIYTLYGIYTPNPGILAGVCSPACVTDAPHRACSSISLSRFILKFVCGQIYIVSFHIKKKNRFYN